MTTIRTHTITVTDDDYTVTLSSAPFNIRSFTISPGIADVLMHQPDDEAARPVRANDSIRTATIVLDSFDNTDTDWDAPIRDLYRLKRMVDGVGSQALRYWTLGDVDPVYLDVKPYNAGAELTTRNEILFGYVDDSAAYYDPAANFNYVTRNITITLYLTEYGEATTNGTVTLSNYLTGSPGMTEYSGSSPTQLAYGITRIDAGATCTIDTTNWCVGGSSQKVVCAAADDGINFPDVDLTGTSHAAFAWIYPTSGTVRFQAYDVDAASVTYYEDIGVGATSQADRTYVDRAGATWYRVPLSIAIWTSTNTCRLQIIAIEGAATFYVDAVYLGQGETNAPAYGWCGPRAIDNRNDHTSTNTSYINYVDVWDIPGDVSALCRIRATVGNSASNTAQYVGAFTDGRYAVGSVTHWVEEDDADITTANSGGSGWTTQSDGTRSGGSYYRYTSATVGSATGGLVWVPTGNEADAFCLTDKRAFALIRTDSTGISHGVYANLELNGVPQSSFNRTLTTASTWEMLDLGMINCAGLLPVTSPSSKQVSVGLYVTDPASGQCTIDVDAMLFIPLTDEFLIAGETLANSDTIWIDGYQDTIITSGAARTYQQFRSPEYNGRFRKLLPNVTNRIIFLLKQASNAHTLTDTITVSIDIKRRTRHLLGSV